MRSDLNEKAKEWLARLGLGEEATHQEAKKAYQRWAMKLHPDRGGGPQEEERFKSVKEAWEGLDQIARSQPSGWGSWRRPKEESLESLKERMGDSWGQPASSFWEDWSAAQGFKSKPGQASQAERRAAPKEEPAKPEASKGSAPDQDRPSEPGPRAPSQPREEPAPRTDESAAPISAESLERAWDRLERRVREGAPMGIGADPMRAWSPRAASAIERAFAALLGEPENREAMSAALDELEASQVHPGAARMKGWTLPTAAAAMRSMRPKRDEAAQGWLDQMESRWGARACAAPDAQGWSVSALIEFDQRLRGLAREQLRAAFAARRAERG